MLKFKSKVGKANANYDSVRLIVPQGLRKILDINPGDHVEWIVNIDNEITVEFKKADE